MLKHLEEHIIQGNMSRDDVIFYYTTVSNMQEVLSLILRRERGLVDKAFVAWGV